MSAGSKYVKDCPVLLPPETHRIFSAMRSAYDDAWRRGGFESGFRGFRSGYSGAEFNGHNQSTTLIKKK